MADKFKAIKADVPSRTSIHAGIERRMDRTVERPKKDFEKYVSPFRAKNRPTIKIKVSRRRDEISAFTGVESNWTQGKTADKNDKFMFNARGTSVRYATMSPEFQAKTKRRTIASSSARGNRDPVFVSRSYPQPGIEAREIEETVADANRQWVINEMHKIFKEAIKEAQLL